MVGENRFVFPPEDVSDTRGETAQDLVLRVYDHPLSLYVPFFGGIGLHFQHLCPRIVHGEQGFLLQIGTYVNRLRAVTRDS
jgi:hypothetical protein